MKRTKREYSFSRYFLTSEFMATLPMNPYPDQSIGLGRNPWGKAKKILGAVVYIYSVAKVTLDSYPDL